MDGRISQSLAAREGLLVLLLGRGSTESPASILQREPGREAGVLQTLACKFVCEIYAALSAGGYPSFFAHIRVRQVLVKNASEGRELGSGQGSRPVRQSTWHGR